MGDAFDAAEAVGRVSTTIEFEDLVQIGMLALVEAARGFEDRGHAAFAT
ncbi:hypothetical protein EUV02_03445 [Polymorphobacter arshaanensis]|uniref:RNA polymerase sigma-70 region 2 domain-containing protein n=1 Tax=Glacieibacterium arshaanense TaxID=2511025 RepID=A0A4Y9ESI4_9SPHN|nr:hypothetical protein EUV02_03445 [Polymorphobacter arshaanensis]